MSIYGRKLCTNASWKNTECRNEIIKNAKEKRIRRYCACHMAFNLHWYGVVWNMMQWNDQECEGNNKKKKYSIPYGIWSLMIWHSTTTRRRNSHYIPLLHHRYVPRTARMTHDSPIYSHNQNPTTSSSSLRTLKSCMKIQSFDMPQIPKDIYWNGWVKGLVGSLCRNILLMLIQCGNSHTQAHTRIAHRHTHAYT